MRAAWAIVALLVGGCAPIPRTPTVWIRAEDAVPDLEPDVDLRVPIADLDDTTAARARVRTLMLLPDCDAALHKRGPLADCMR